MTWLVSNFFLFGKYCTLSNGSSNNNTVRYISIIHEYENDLHSFYVFAFHLSAFLVSGLEGWWWFSSTSGELNIDEKD